MGRGVEQDLRVPAVIRMLRSFPHKRESSSFFSQLWVPAFAGTSGVAVFAFSPSALFTPAAPQFGPPPPIEAGRQEGKRVFSSAPVAARQKPNLHAITK